MVHSCKTTHGTTVNKSIVSLRDKCTQHDFANSYEKRHSFDDDRKCAHLPRAKKETLTGVGGPSSAPKLSQSSRNSLGVVWRHGCEILPVHAAQKRLAFAKLLSLRLPNVVGGRAIDANNDVAYSIGKLVSLNVHHRGLVVLLNLRLSQIPWCICWTE